MTFHNLLVNSLPETVMVDGREFFIETDFRAGIQFEFILMDKTLSNKEKFQKVMELYYPSGAPLNKEVAFKRVIEFYSCKKGKNDGNSTEKEEENQQEESTKVKKRCYDFRYDGDYIYSAFLQQYKLDLTTEKLHWWKFMALFRSLTEDTLMVQIMGYRGADTGKIKNKAERERIAKLKEVYALPDEMTNEEKVELAGSVFGG